MVLYIINDIYCDIHENNEFILKDFCISHDDNKIFEQKIALSELDTNVLFDEFFVPLKNIKLEYGFYGGKGCDFSLDITQENQLK